MWPSFSTELGEQTIHLPFYIILVAAGICHIIIGVDSRARKEGFAIEGIGKCTNAILIAILGGGLVTWSLTPFLYSGPKFWGPISAMPGIIGGLAIFSLAIKRYRLDIWKHLNLIAPFVCFAHAWGRLGCFSAGCCHGQPTSSFLGMHFHPTSPANGQFGDAPLHATQLYEAALLLALGWILINRCPPAMRFAYYTLAYGCGRFLLEFIRGDDRGAIFNITILSPSQILSLGYIAFGLGLIFRFRNHSDGLPEKHLITPHPPM